MPSPSLSRSGQPSSSLYPSASSAASGSYPRREYRRCHGRLRGNHLHHRPFGIRLREDIGPPCRGCRPNRYPDLGSHPRPGTRLGPLPIWTLVGFIGDTVRIVIQVWAAILVLVSIRTSGFWRQPSCGSLCRPRHRRWRTSGIVFVGSNVCAVGWMNAKGMGIAERNTDARPWAAGGLGECPTAGHANLVAPSKSVVHSRSPCGPEVLSAISIDNDVPMPSALTETRGRKGASVVRIPNAGLRVCTSRRLNTSNSGAYRYVSRKVADVSPTVRRRG